MLKVLQIAAVPIVMEEYADNTNSATLHNISATLHNTSATHQCSPSVHWNWIYHNHSQEPGTQLNDIQTNPDLLSTSGIYELTPDIYSSIPESMTAVSESSASNLDSSPSTSQLSTSTSKIHVASKELCDSPLQKITQISSSLSLETLSTTSAMSTTMFPVTTSESSVFTNKYTSESRSSESCSPERFPSTPELCRSTSMPELSILEISSFRPGCRIEISRPSDITYFLRGSMPKSSKSELPMFKTNRSGSMGKSSQTILAPLDLKPKSNESKLCESISCNFKSYESKSFESKSCQSKSYKSKSCKSNSGESKSCEANCSDFKSWEFNSCESISFEDRLSFPLSDRSYKGVRAGLEHILDIRRKLIKEHPKWNISSHKLPGLYWSFPQLHETDERRRDKLDNIHTEIGDKTEGRTNKKNGRRDVATNIKLKERIGDNNEREGEHVKEDELRLLARNESRRWRFIGGQLRKMGDQFQLDYEKGRGKTRLELPVVSCVDFSAPHCLALSALSLACLGLYITLR